LQQPGKKGSSSSWPQSQKAAWQIVLKNDWFALLQLEQTQNIPELQMMHSLALMNVKHRAISKPLETKREFANNILAYNL